MNMANDAKRVDLVFIGGIAPPVTMTIITTTATTTITTMIMINHEGMPNNKVNK